jgi:hypothetical protein
LNPTLRATTTLPSVPRPSRRAWARRTSGSGTRLGCR